MGSQPRQRGERNVLQAEGRVWGRTRLGKELLILYKRKVLCSGQEESESGVLLKGPLQEKNMASSSKNRKKCAVKGPT